MRAERKCHFFLRTAANDRQGGCERTAPSHAYATMSRKRTRVVREDYAKNSIRTSVGSSSQQCIDNRIYSKFKIPAEFLILINFT